MSGALIAAIAALITATIVFRWQKNVELQQQIYVEKRTACIELIRLARKSEKAAFGAGLEELDFSDFLMELVAAADVAGFYGGSRLRDKSAKIIQSVISTKMKRDADISESEASEIQETLDGEKLDNEEPEALDFGTCLEEVVEGMRNDLFASRSPLELATELLENSKKLLRGKKK